ncbi:NAD(P)H-dependent oxidoreductase [Paraburkholderia sp. MM5477-R1]|uniref:NAD(P)H-dependent oxidoreductase n=1 Tax=Paraburkholderia sp. MM5477-R1 TaxID=2991062 RepID=UPI003D23B03F
MNTKTKPLVILAHPDMRISRLNACLARALSETDSATVHDIYQAFPSGVIDVSAEQKLVEAHDRIIFQFPLTWYSCPPFLSTWLVEVYKRGWAYGPGGRALNFKTFGVAVTTGSNGRDYTRQGRYRRSMEEVLVPFELLARHSGMHYLTPFALTAARELADEELAVKAAAYRQHVVSSAPISTFEGKDDDRAKTVYAAHHYSSESRGNANE